MGMSLYVVNGKERARDMFTGMVVPNTHPVFNHSFQLHVATSLANGTYLFVPLLYSTLGESKGFVSPFISGQQTSYTDLDSTPYTLALTSNNPDFSFTPLQD